MAVTFFDTHGFVKRLTEAGMPPQQAEVLADEQARLVSEHPVTRDYLDNRLVQMEQRLTMRLGGMIVVAVGVVATLVKVL